MPLIPYVGSNGNLFQPAHASELDGAASYQDAWSNDLLDPRGLGTSQGFNASMVLKLSQQHTVQVLVTCTSSISLLAAVCAVYWFWMMRRNFRRDLVLLLILGGSWKSLWFMVFSAVTFTQGKIQTETTFCQASGYMLQVGFEMCDMAVLFMSMHMYLQIFPPTRLTFFGHDGLYRVRHWVWGAFILFPNLTAALAFVNPAPGYMAQGGFCSLPLRPMWYRLALFWIPRYLIWIYVIFVAVSITRYVGSEFKVFGQARDSSTSQHRQSTSANGTETTTLRGESTKHATQKTSEENDDDADGAPDDVESTLRVKPKKLSLLGLADPHQANTVGGESIPVWAPRNDSDAASNPFASQNKSASTSRRGSRQVAHGVISEDFGQLPALDSRHRPSIVSMGSKISSIGVSFEDQPVLAPMEALPTGVKSDVARQPSNKAMKFRRAAIQRQLRLLFIYPCVYMLLWIVPFVVTCMNYIDYWAQHPVFPLKVIQLFCMTIMTFVDVFIFCWRERPWRHIPGADGTFLGSFVFWRFCFAGTWANGRRMSRAPSNVPDADASHDESNASTGFLAALRRWTRRSSARSREADGSEGQPGKPHRRTYSGGSDRRHLEAERAAERLAMERAEYEANRTSLNERRTSVVSQGQQALAVPKNWFDKREKDLMEDADDTMDEKRDLH